MRQLKSIIKLIIFVCIFLIAICIGVVGISVFFIADIIEDYLNRKNNSHI